MRIQGVVARLRWVVMLVVAALVLSACGNGDDSEPAGEPEADEVEEAAPPEEPDEADDGLEGLIAAAQAEGELVWYNSGPPDQATALLEAFEEEYGIPVEMLRLTTGPLSERYSAEQEAGTVFADLITVANPLFFNSGYEQGWFMETSVDEIPNIANLEDPEYHREDTMVIGSIALVVMAYNTDRVGADEVPSGFEDLLDPRWEGELIMGDPRGVPVWLLTNWFFHEQFGPEFLEGLREQNFTVIDSVIPGGQAVAAGEYSILPYTLKGNHDELIAEGAPIDYIEVPATTGMPFDWAISAEAEHPNAAKLFMNFMLSFEGQSIYNNNSGISTIAEDVPNSFEMPEDFFPFLPGIVDAIENQDRLMELLGL